MVHSINGATGKYPTDIPGGYGRNAAIEWSKQPDNSPSVDVQYSPPGTVGTEAFYQNLFGFQEDSTPIDKFDKDRNGSLNLDEFIPFGTSEDTEKQIQSYKPGLQRNLFKARLHALINSLFKVLDRDKNGEIDLVEFSANTLLKDGFSSLIGKKLISKANTLSEKVAAYAQAFWFKTKYPSAFDGILTKVEGESWVDVGINKHPEFFGEILDDLIKDHNLYQRYQDFKKLNA